MWCLMALKHLGIWGVRPPHSYFISCSCYIFTAQCWGWVQCPRPRDAEKSEGAKPSRNMLETGLVLFPKPTLSYHGSYTQEPSLSDLADFPQKQPLQLKHVLVAQGTERSCVRARSVTESRRLTTALKHLSPHLDRPQSRVKATTQHHLIFGPLLRQLVIFFLDQCEFYTVRTGLRPPFQ